MTMRGAVCDRCASRECRLPARRISHSGANSVRLRWGRSLVLPARSCGVARALDLLLVTRTLAHDPSDPLVFMHRLRVVAPRAATAAIAASERSGARAAILLR